MPITELSIMIQLEPHSKKNGLHVTKIIITYTKRQTKQVSESIFFFFVQLS